MDNRGAARAVNVYPWAQVVIFGTVIGLSVLANMMFISIRLIEVIPVSSTVKGPVLGIDMGSSYIRTAVWDKDTVSVIPNHNGRPKTPNVISVTADGRVYTGDDALARKASNSIKTFGQIYQLLGKPWDDERVSRLSKYMKLIVDNNDRPSVQISENTSYPEEILAVVLLTEVKTAADEYLQSKEPLKVVLTVPAYFNDHQRRAVKYAAELADLEVIKLMNAP